MTISSKKEVCVWYIVLVIKSSYIKGTDSGWLNVLFYFVPLGGESMRLKTMAASQYRFRTSSSASSWRNQHPAILRAIYHVAGELLRSQKKKKKKGNLFIDLIFTSGIFRKYNYMTADLISWLANYHLQRLAN